MFTSACRRGILGLSAGNGAGPAIASDWAARVVANGGTVSASTQSAVGAFVTSCMNSGVWGKINRVNLFCGDQLAAALVPLKVGGGNATDTNGGGLFVAGDYSEAAGLAGNGTSKYLDTGLVPSATLSLTSTHIAAYNRSSVVGLNGFSIGAVTDVLTRTALVAPFTDSIVYSDLHNSSGNGRLTSGSAIGTPYGFLVGSRVSGTDHQIYRNGASIANNAVFAGVLTALTMHVFGLNNAGVPSVFSDNRVAGYSIGSGLTAAEALAYYSAMQAFQTSLARNV